jgi:hypothetical protein
VIQIDKCYILYKNALSYNTSKMKYRLILLRRRRIKIIELTNESRIIVNANGLHCVQSCENRNDKKLCIVQIMQIGK